MNTENLWSNSDITPAQIDAIVRKARASRAAVMRESLIDFTAAFKRWVAHFRPAANRKGAWA